MPENDPLHDLLAPLRSPAVGGPPPAEIRRRGERRQRRNRALLATGVAAAVAAVAIPLTLTRSSETRGEAPVATEPTATMLVPLARIDITAGMRGPAERGPDYDGGAPDTCAESVLPRSGGDGVTAIASARVLQTEGSRRRNVIAYNAPSSATAAFDEFRNVAGSCADTEQVEAGATDYSYLARQGSAGEAVVVRVALLGTVVVEDSAEILGAGSAQVVDETVDLLREQSVELQAVLGRAVASPATAPDLIGRVGPVRIGMTRSALESLPGMDYSGAGADGCQPFVVPAGDGGIVTGVAGPRDVVSIDVPALAAPAGLAVGDDATIWGLDDAGESTLDPAPTGDHLYKVATDAGRIAGLSIVLRADDCGL